MTEGEFYNVLSWTTVILMMATVFFASSYLAWLNISNRMAILHVRGETYIIDLARGDLVVKSSTRWFILHMVRSWKIFAFEKSRKKHVRSRFVGTPLDYKSVRIPNATRRHVDYVLLPSTCDLLTVSRGGWPPSDYLEGITLMEIKQLFKVVK